jgi:hypothetical protein
MKFDPLHFGWFNLHLDQLFEEIINLNTEMPILASSTCYTQNSDWGTRRGSGDLLQIGSFSFCLGPFDNPIVLLNMARSVIAVKYLEI